jgi:hypothetical protein
VKCFSFFYILIAVSQKDKNNSSVIPAEAGFLYDQHLTAMCRDRLSEITNTLLNKQLQKIKNTGEGK